MSVGIYPTGGFEGSRNTTFTKNDLKMMGSQGFDNFAINQDRMDTDALEIMFNPDPPPPPPPPPPLETPPPTIIYEPGVGTTIIPPDGQGPDPDDKTNDQYG